ncbi:MAG: DnaJ domain-containing protein [Deltaproteobacteria bacterium]|nr:DnaJ domain-containing protein [Deltaproteobacteria bacterium]
MSTFDMIPSPKGNRKARKCLACGEDITRNGRRYCSKECRQQILWVLSLSKGLLKAFNARYAAFSFNANFILLDVLPVWAKDISRFVGKRTAGKKPADDLKDLVLESAGEWYRVINNGSSRSYASLFLLRKNHDSRIAAGAIRPGQRRRLRFSKKERECMKVLELKMEELYSEGQEVKIKTSYKKLAKIHHPDMGGDAEKFRKVNEANEQMLLWAKNPQYTCRKALEECWSYDGSTNRWSPPL